MGNLEIGVILLALLTAAIIACTVVLYPYLKDLVEELRKDV